MVSADSSDCRTVHHEIEVVEICSQPQKIVALGPYVLEPLLALDVQPAGYADRFAFHAGDYANPAEQIPYLGELLSQGRRQPLANVGTAGAPSLEAILQLQPDLIIATDENADQYAQLSKIAPTLILDWQDAEETLNKIAEAVDRSEQAEQLWSRRQTQITAAKEAFAPVVAEHPEVLLISSSNLQDIQLNTSGSSLCHSLLQELGFQIVSSPELNESAANGWASLSLEALPQLKSDSILILGSNLSDFEQINDTKSFENHQLSGIKAVWEGSAIAQSLDASKAERVYFVPAYPCLGIPGPIGTELYLEELQAQLLSNKP